MRERVGDEGKGIRTIIQMVQLTRQDCAIASAGLMRSGLAHALHHARHRSVFQKHLADQPLMQAVLSDMALHVEASIALVMRLCRVFDRAPHDASEAAYMRLLTPAIKYWVCKSAPGFLYEAMECLGGNGYVEEGILARHYRESPVNAIWEGSGNVMCLDVLRALSREADAASAVLQRSRPSETQGLPGAGEAVAFIGKAFRRPDSERVARLAVEKLALLAAAAALNRGVAAPCRTVRRDAACRESRQHVRRGRSRQLTMSAACWSGRCRECSVIRLMASVLTRHRRSRQAADADSADADRNRVRAPQPAARLEILGHGAVGPVHLRRDVRRPDRGRRLFRAAAGRSVRHGRRDPCRRRRPDDLAVGHHGTARRARRGSGSRSVRRARRLPIIWRCAGPSWSNLLIGVVALVVLVVGWDLLSRALGREVTPGFMGDVLKSAQADGALWLLVIAFCVAAPMSEEILRARLSLSRLVGIVACASPAPSCCRRWPGPSLHLQYDWFFFGEVFSHRPAARLSALSQQLDLADDRAARAQQSRGDGADVLAGRLHASTSLPARSRSAS